MNSANVLIYSGVIIGVLLAISLLKKEQGNALKLFLFWGMVIPTGFATFYLAGTTYMENHRSATGGPVHWHADFQIYSCGNLVKLKEPTGLSNRIGTPLLHEHGDSRIHIEGTVKDLSTISLGEFFKKIGGQLTNTFLMVPTADGQYLMQNNMSCPNPAAGKPDASVKPVLQVFLYKTHQDTKTITQEKLSNLPGYILTGESKIPPGDCLIIEFAPEKAKTEHICGFYQIAINNGEYTYQK